MLNWIKTQWKILICQHEWRYDGHAHTEGDTAGNKESHWYWHLESCDKCDGQREVMNDARYDACGYMTTGE